MTAVDDLATVIELACLTEDRTDREQDALLRVAARTDAKLNADVTTNHRVGPASRLYRLASSTRVVVDDQIHRTKPKVAAKLAAQADRWEQARGSR